MSVKKRKRQGPEETVRKFRDADAMLTAGKYQSLVLQSREVGEATSSPLAEPVNDALRWYGGMKSEEAKRLKFLRDENRQVQQLVADQALDNQMLKHVASGNHRGGPVGAEVHSSSRGLLSFPARR